MKVISAPQSGQIGNIVYVNSRYGQLARQYVHPRNPRTHKQQRNRGNFGAVASRWRALTVPQFDLPPAEPTFSPNPVAELVVTNTGGTITLKLRVPSLPAQYTLVQGAAPVSTGVRYVQHFPFLGLLPPPNDLWSDITGQRQLFISISDN